MSETPRPRRPRRQPFGGSLQIEAEKATPYERTLNHGLDRFDRLSSKGQTWAAIVGGGLASAGLWAFRVLSPDTFAALANFAALSDHLWFMILALASPAVLAMGVLDLLRPPPPAEASAGSFGGYLEQQQAESAWRRRLLAIGIGMAHAVVYLWM